jgi:hypothetical protein
VLLIAALAGTIFGAMGAVTNRVRTRDESLLWVIGGAVGGVLAMLGWTGVILGAATMLGLGPTMATAVVAGLIIVAVGGLLGAVASPLLDHTDSRVAWSLSFLLKWVQSPLLTTVGLLATVVVTVGSGTVGFRRGMLFISVGAGNRALALGAVAWTQSGCFNPDGTVPDNLARHEAMHSRTAAAIGELGFYLTYITIGAFWGLRQGGSWNGLNAAGRGNPFEKTAHTSA